MYNIKEHVESYLNFQHFYVFFYKLKIYNNNKALFLMLVNHQCNNNINMLFYTIYIIDIFQNMKKIK